MVLHKGRGGGICEGQGPRGGVEQLLSRFVVAGEASLLPCSVVWIWGLRVAAEGVGLLRPAHFFERGRPSNVTGLPVREYLYLIEAWLAAGEPFPFNYV